MVEVLDWQDRVATAKLALKADIDENSGFGFSERLVTTPCLRRQLARIEAALLSRNSAGQQLVPTHRGAIYTSVYVHPSRGWSASEWSSVVADNIPAHMSREDRTLYRDLYLEAEIMRQLSVDEDRETADLDLLSRPMPIDEATRADLLRIILRERQRVDLMYVVARYSLKQLADNGRRVVVTPAYLAEINTLNCCRANGSA